MINPQWFKTNHQQDKKIYQFEHVNIWYMSLKMIMPALLISLMMGVYLFIDQLMMVRFIPTDNIHTIEAVLKPLYSNSQWNNIINHVDNYQDAITNAVSSAINFNSSLGMIIASFSFLISGGCSVLFGQALARRKFTDIDTIYRTGFYGSIIISLCVTFVMIFISGQILHIMLPNQLVDNQDPTSLLNWGINQLTLKWSNQFIFWLNLSLVFSALINLITFLNRGENKVLYITISSVVSSLINILMDYLLMGVVALGMAGAGIATLVSIIINFISIMAYLCYLNRHSKTKLNFQILKHFEINFRILISSILLGSSVFLRNLSVAIANLVYIPVMLHVIKATASGSGLNETMFLGIMGGIIPIYNLFFYAIFGIIDGARALLSYNYAHGNYQRTKQAFYIAIMFAFIYGLIVIVIINFGFSNQLLNLFHVERTYGSKGLNFAQSLMLIVTMQIPIFALGVGGMLLFQSCGKTFMSNLTSITQGLITFVPLIYIFYFSALQNNDIWLFAWCGSSNTIISGGIIFLAALIYSKFYMGKKEKYQIPNEMLNNFISRYLTH